MGIPESQTQHPVYLPYHLRDSSIERALKGTIQAYAAQKQSIRLLDFGAGYGIRSESVVELLKPRETSVYLYDVDPNLLRAARERLSRVAPVFDFVSGQVKFDILLCLSVLEMIPDNDVVLGALRTLRANMDASSLLIIQHVNWHPLAARTGYWFLKSLLSPSTFGSAIRTREAELGYRNYSRFSTLLRLIHEAGLKVDKVIPGPYLGQLSVPVPHSMRERNLLLVSART